MPDTFVKDPDAVLDFKFDWAALTNETGDSDWLDTDNSETISSYTVTVATGLTKDSDSKGDTDTSVTVWVSGGTDGEDYDITCEIVTSAGRTDQRTMTIMARHR